MMGPKTGGAAASQWTEYKITPAFYTSFPSVAVNNGTVIAVSDGGSGILLRSTDGGVTFTSSTPVANAMYTAIGSGAGAAANSGNFVAAGPQNNQILSTDGGLTWSSKNYPNTPSGNMNNIQQIRVLDGKFMTVGHFSVFGASDNGDFTLQNNIGGTNYAVMMDNQDNIVLAMSATTNFFWFKKTNIGTPSNTWSAGTFGNWNYGSASNSGAAWSNGSVMAVALFNGTIVYTPNINTAVSTATIPTSILNSRFVARLKWFSERSEWIICGNNQGQPTPLFARSPDLINWTSIDATASTVLGNVGAINDVAYDSVSGRYILATTSKNFNTYGVSMFTYKP